MNVTEVAKSHHADIPKASSRNEWKLFDSLREQIAGYAREDAAQGVYMGNKFLALRKSEVAKAAPDRAALIGKANQEMADQKENAEVTRQGRAGQASPTFWQIGEYNCDKERYLGC